jgi:hypothetical protein
MSLLIGQGMLISSILMGHLLTPPLPQPEVIAAHIYGLENDSILHPLIGTWRGADPTTQAPITLVFNPLGQVYLLAEDDAENPTAIKMWYEINTLANPSQLDLQLNAEQTAPTVFEITPQGQLRLGLEGISPETPRPETLENATVFTKVSENTAIADRYQVVALSPPTATASVPVQYISVLAQSQLSYFAQMGEFTDDLADLGITGLMETQQYNYAFQTFNDNPEQLGILAEPKEPDLPSYIGAIFVQGEGEKQNLVAGVCQTDNPATLAPAMPTLSNNSLQCPAGSTPVQ